MVSISHERQVESERRLRAVLRAAELAHLPGAWCFQRFDGDPPFAALATVTDVDGRCALAPATPDAVERFGVTLTTFAPRIDNSGYVGWLATTIKQRLGSGVFVICGDNPRRGGIFDYLGYPLEVAGAVRGLLDELRRPGGGDPLDLDLRVFEVVSTSPASAVSRDTFFEFHERDGLVEAGYAGGGIVQGRLVGRRENDRVSAAYSQLGVDGRLHTGTATMRVEPDAGGGILLVEEYTWADGTTGRNVLRSAERHDAG
ncbi:hypothetical protein Sru01_51110 [Sphaerisporangium rufum]|uniref:Uncharacterized protein n=1 Tax=Sphaerisporangium rufum TaxID=1381558 RepID=A0A919V1V9_9ACTN|nr:DUF6196 family protein [Sphaerisporangium rufum]GII80129.1 hypothetical protein Sru01_51110 [Sphaerisporangium rufum]